MTINKSLLGTVSKKYISVCNIYSTDFFLNPIKNLYNANKLYRRHVSSNFRQPLENSETISISKLQGSRQHVFLRLFTKSEKNFSDWVHFMRESVLPIKNSTIDVSLRILWNLVKIYSVEHLRTVTSICIMKATNCFKS